MAEVQALKVLPEHPEPPVGTWARDRFGGITYHQVQGGWGEPGVVPLGVWKKMYKARGPYVEVGPWGQEIGGSEMTETYMPKFGDKVRATLGENVLVGKVAWYGDSMGYPAIDLSVTSNAAHQLPLYGYDGWTFEQVIDVPKKPFAVVASADNKKNGYVRDVGGMWTSVVSGSFASESTIADLIRDEGYKVVFEGVDE